VAAGPVSRILSAGKLPFRGPRTAGRPFLWAAHYCAALATYPKVLTRRAGTRPPPLKVLSCKQRALSDLYLLAYSSLATHGSLLRIYSDGETPSLFGLAPCGVCPARSITRAAVRSCRTFSPLPPHPAFGPAKAVYFLWHFPSIGLDADLPDVIRHTALRSSDFPPLSLDATRAAVRSSCLLDHYIRSRKIGSGRAKPTTHQGCT
jgi:hypothetical protein